MIQTIISLQNFFQNAVDSLVSLLKVLVFSKFSTKIPKATQEKCSILGNGPSLNITLEKDLDFLKKTEKICINLFAVTDSYMALKPQNYLLLDEAFVNPTHETAQKAIIAIGEKTSWKINLFVPKKFLKAEVFKRNILSNPNINVVPFNYTIVKGFDWLVHGLFRNNLGMPQCQNVLVGTLFYAINMGFKEVYLFGADHSWHENIKLDENNNLFAVDTHFYGEKNYTKLQPSYMSRMLLSLHKAFYGYEVLAKYAQKQQVKIFNASAKSYIDVFEKVNLTNGIKK